MRDSISGMVEASKRRIQDEEKKMADKVRADLEAAKRRALEKV